MSKNATPLTERPEWKALLSHYDQVKDVHLRNLFAEDEGRAQKFMMDAGDLHLDYSKNRVTDETLGLLLALAESSDLREAIDAMFNGAKINRTENRAVLHTAGAAPIRRLRRS